MILPILLLTLLTILFFIFFDNLIKHQQERHQFALLTKQLENRTVTTFNHHRDHLEQKWQEQFYKKWSIITYCNDPND